MTDDVKFKLEELEKELDNLTVPDTTRMILEDLTNEVYSWLPRDYKAGEIVYLYRGYTYDVISPLGIACTEVNGETPFYEFPIDCIGPL